MRTSREHGSDTHVACIPYPSCFSRRIRSAKKQARPVLDLQSKTQQWKIQVLCLASESAMRHTFKGFLHGLRVLLALLQHLFPHGVDPIMHRLKLFLSRV